MTRLVPGRVCQTCGKQDSRSDEELQAAGWKMPWSRQSGQWLQQRFTACPDCPQGRRLRRRDRFGRYR